MGNMTRVNSTSEYSTKNQTKNEQKWFQSGVG